MERERTIALKPEPNENNSYTFEDWRGVRVKAYRDNGSMVTRFHHYQGIYFALYDRTEELVESDKALAEERQCGARDKHQFQEDLANIQEELAAARKEIEALKKVRIDDPSSQTCGTCEHENKVSEPRCPCWNCRRKTADKWEPKKPMPAPAPVEYACPECACPAGVKFTESEGFSQMVCGECFASSGEYEDFDGPHESWIKKPEESTA